MTSERDIERVLDRWFVDRPTEVSERVLDDVADRISRQRQPPAWRVYGRDTPVNSYLKPLLAVAAVVLVAVIGYSLLPRDQGVAAPSPTPTTSPSPSPSPSLAYTWPRTLAEGTYTTRMIWDVPFAWQFTVPDGWQSRDVEVMRDDLSVAFHLAGNTYSDPCSGVLMDPPTGPTVDDLATALAALHGFDATTPVPVIVDGGDARYLELAVREDAGCEEPRLWADPPDSYNGEGVVGGSWWPASLPNMRMWILNVDDTRIVVSALWSDTATQADLDELQAVVDSVRIVPATGPSIALPSPA